MIGASALACARMRTLGLVWPKVGLSGLAIEPVTIFVALTAGGRRLGQGERGLFDRRFRHE